MKRDDNIRFFLQVDELFYGNPDLFRVSAAYGYVVISGAWQAVENEEKDETAFYLWMN